MSEALLGSGISKPQGYSLSGRGGSCKSGQRYIQETVDGEEGG